MRSALLGLLILAAAGSAHAQILDPVHWSLTSDVAKAPPGSTVVLKLTAKLDPGWHLYSLTQPKPGPDGGPITSTAALAESPALGSFKIFQPPPETKFDPNFKLETQTFEKDVVFLIPADLAKHAAGGPVEITAQFRYQACDATQCLPPKRKTAVFALAVDASAAAPPEFVPPTGYKDIKSAATSSTSPAPATSATEPPAGLLPFLLTAFGLGLASIFTPCVFPMIPITVSFFLNQKGGLFQAAVFTIGIIVFFTGLGLGVSAAVGPFGVVQLGSNVWVNTFIALVFTVFAISLLGAFEITLPSGLLTSLDKASRRGGMVGTLIMGLTFALTSFACVGPFFGTLLTASAQAGGSRPAVGMMTFAAGLAAPFFFLAAFPSYLKKLPRSGGWMLRIKVVMGFILLAVMLKYAANIDQVMQWNFLTRERFLAAWFVMFSLAGLYLLGFVRLEGVEPGDPMGIGRLLTASALLIFAISLLPGMFGAPLGELDAFVPVATGPGIGGRSAATGPAWMKNQYPEALAKAKQENKLVLVSFTGYACTNCHWMKANMFPRPEIADAMKDFVMVELFTDGTDKASDDNQKLEEEKLKTVSLPTYAIIDPEGKVLAQSGYTPDAAKFLTFLKTKPASL